MSDVHAGSHPDDLETARHRALQALQQTCDRRRRADLEDEIARLTAAIDRRRTGKVPPELGYRP